MFDWFKKDDAPAAVAEDQALLKAIKATLPAADDDTVSIVAATAGLLASVAYADRKFSEAEERRVHVLLQTVEGISTEGAEAILHTLRKGALHYSTLHAPRFCRALRELTDRTLRCHVLDLLVEVAAADHEITHNEVTVLRQLTTALGLDQTDYNAAQELHRAKLSALRR